MSDKPIRIEESPRRVRTLLGGELVADSKTPKLVYGVYRLPRYYFPREHVREPMLEPAGEETVEGVGKTMVYHVKGGSKIAEAAARVHIDPPEEHRALSELIMFEWKAMDHWFEEDEEVFVHAIDPYHRVDVRDSTRHVQVYVDGEQVAESRSPRMLFETSLRRRVYLPKTDVKMQMLIPSDHRTGCPYKGDAKYWHVKTKAGQHDNLVWCYDTPRYEALKIAGMICFYDEKCELVVD